MYSLSPIMSQINENFFWESVFSNFHRYQNDVKLKSVIWPPFWNGIFFSLIWLFLVRKYHSVVFMAKFCKGKRYSYGGPMETPLDTHSWEIPWPLKCYSYTPRTLRACCSQSKFRILNIRESSARAIFLYNCTPNISRSANASVSVA